MPSVRIPLHSRKYPGLTAIVEDVDAELVSQHRWWPNHREKTIYAYTQINGKTVFLHCLIAGTTRGERVDHINHDGLDCRRSNLRVCTDIENKRNRSGLTCTNSTGVVGVERLPSGRYRALIWIDGRQVGCGTYDTAEQAAHARDDRAREVYGAFGVFNFPNPDERGVR